MPKLRKNVVVSGQLLYDHLSVLAPLLDALDNSDLVALTGFPFSVVNNFRYVSNRLGDNLFAGCKPKHKFLKLH